MIRKNSITRAGLIAVLALTMQQSAQAQDVHFTQFNASPLIVNPAFTGNFSGQWRASAIYRNQWRNIAGFETYAVSVDAPIVHDLTHDDYLAAGLQLYNDRAGDGNFSNLSALGSVAYHKFLGANVDKVISVGFQGGYTQKSFDITKLFFQNQFVDGQFLSLPNPEGLGNRDGYAVINAGVSWAHSISERVGYALGVGANNINQPGETFRSNPNSENGLPMRYTAQAGAIAYVSDRLSLRPAVLYQQQATADEIVAGNEFNYALGNTEIRSYSTAVFAGVWYRNNDAIMATAGLEFKGFRLGLAYDYNTSNLKTATNGNGGFEISLTYIAPDPLDFARRLIYPCARF
jgi:type IX secretion system PorP/SprF family membrane protein